MLTFRPWQSLKRVFQKIGALSTMLWLFFYFFLCVSCLKGKFVSHIRENSGKTLQKHERLYRTGEKREGVRVTFNFKSDSSNFFKGCQAVSKTKGREGARNMEVSNLFISLKKVTVIFQLCLSVLFCSSLVLITLFSPSYPTPDHSWMWFQK